MEEEASCGCKGSSLRSYGKGANIRQRHTNSASRKDDMFVPEETLTEWLYGCIVVNLQTSSRLAHSTNRSAHRRYTEIAEWACRATKKGIRIDRGGAS